MVSLRIMVKNVQPRYVMMNRPGAQTRMSWGHALALTAPSHWICSNHASNLLEEILEASLNSTSAAGQVVQLLIL